MKPKAFYIDPQGKRRELTDVKASDVPSFVVATRDDGVRVRVHLTDLKVEDYEQRDQKTVA